MPLEALNQDSAGLRGNSFGAALRTCAGSGVLFVDSQKRIAAVTPGAVEPFGLRGQDLAAQGCDVLPEALRQVLEAAWASGGNGAYSQTELPGPDGVRRSLHIKAIPLHSSDNDPGLMVVVSDFTAARQMEEQLQRIDKLVSLGTLSAGIAHEVRNALVAARTFIDLLLERNQEAELAEIVRRELRRIDGLLSQMLRYAGPSGSALAPIRVHPILDRSLRLIRHQLEQKGIAIHQDLAAPTDLVQGDADQLEQVFVNLFLNAAEAMTSGGSLTLSTILEQTGSDGPVGGMEGGGKDQRGAGQGESRRSDRLCICVKDTGVGIPAEQASRVFDTFFTTKAGGSGLGLSMSRRIVVAHGGEISVESQPGQGSIFRVRLPVVGGA